MLCHAGDAGVGGAVQLLDVLQLLLKLLLPLTQQLMMIIMRSFGWC